MENDKVQYANLKRALIFLLPIGCTILFYIFHKNEEKNENIKLEECSFYTIAIPIKMSSSHRLFFYYKYGGNRYEYFHYVSANDLGAFYTQKSILKGRYWLRVYCKDSKILRIYWKIKVPDTIQYIPINGWKEIPYGLKIQYNDD